MLHLWNRQYKSITKIRRKFETALLMKLERVFVIPDNIAQSIAISCRQFPGDFCEYESANSFLPVLLNHEEIADGSVDVCEAPGYQVKVVISNCNSWKKLDHL